MPAGPRARMRATAFQVDDHFGRAFDEYRCAGGDLLAAGFLGGENLHASGLLGYDLQGDECGVQADLGLVTGGEGLAYGFQGLGVRCDGGGQFLLPGFQVLGGLADSLEQALEIGKVLAGLHEPLGILGLPFRLVHALSSLSHFLQVGLGLFRLGVQPVQFLHPFGGVLSEPLEFLPGAGEFLSCGLDPFDALLEFRVPGRGRLHLFLLEVPVRDQCAVGLGLLPCLGQFLVEAFRVPFCLCPFGAQVLDPAAYLLEDFQVLEDSALLLFQFLQAVSEFDDLGRVLAGLELAPWGEEAEVGGLDPLLQAAHARAGHLHAERLLDVFDEVAGKLRDLELALGDQKDLGQSPVGRLGEAPAGGAGREEVAHELVRFFAFGKADEFVLFLSEELGGGVVQEPLLEPVVGSGLGEFQGHLRGEVAAPRAERLHVTAAYPVAVEEPSEERFQEGGLAHGIGRVDDVDSLPKGADRHGVGEAPPALHPDGSQNHDSVPCTRA